MLLQSVVLAVGALLVIKGEASAGIIIAASIISGRALAPIDLAIANWKGFVAARQAWKRLSTLSERLPATRAPMQLPAPSSRLSVEGASIVPPGETRVVVQDVTFALNRGTALGIIGPSASGKSSLARALVGTWQMARGRLQLDGSDIGQWSASDLGRSIGYLPQDAEIMSGTVADNISRFDPEATPETVIAAAKAAGAHEMIVELKDGFDTPVGEQGTALSAGQRQRVALARALYGDPFLVVLDEPNSNLDTDGDAALVRAIEAAKARGAVVIVIAHRTSVLAAVDHVLAMNHGRQVAFGPRDEILKKLIRKDPAGPGPLMVVPQGAST
jgi:ATP-binding cassette subfamily C protein